MKLYSVALTAPDTKVKSILSFKQGVLVKLNDIASSSTLRFYNVLLHAFGGEGECRDNAVIDFCLNENNYIITLTVNDKGTVRKNLKQKTAEGTVTVARENAVAKYLNNEANCDLLKVIKNCFVDVSDYKEFAKKGNLRVFDDIKGLMEVIAEADQSFVKTQQMTQDAIKKVFKLAEKGNLTDVTKEDLDKLNSLIKEKRKDAAVLSAQLLDAKQKDVFDVLTADLVNDREKTNQELEALKNYEQTIEEYKKRVEAYLDTRDVLPQAKLIANLQTEIEEATKKHRDVKEEYEWLNQEFDSIAKQLTQKQSQSDKLIALKSRLQVAIEEEKRIKRLESINAELNDSLNKLSIQVDKLTTKKVNLKNKLENIEQSINDIRGNIKEFSVPNQSIGSIVENVRAETKIIELSSQIDRLQTEIAAKESDISDKEMTISGQTRRLNSLLSLDNVINPLKTKDSIIKVIDSKINKLTLINDSLKTKQKNYNRTLEDFSFKQLKVEQSSQTLNTLLSRKQFEKEEEFKRQVILAGQRNDSVTEALPAQLTDSEIEHLKNDIANRIYSKNEIIERASAIKGALGEIERQIAINNAEIESMRYEKANINRKYMELVAQNKNEATQQYLKSLESNNSTKYLMDIQEEVVRSDTELRMYKKDAEKLQGRLTELLSRLKYLNDAAGDKSTTENLEYLTQTNDQLKRELSDISDRLNICYTEHKKLSDELDELNYTEFRVQELIMETMQKIKTNEREIVDSREKIRIIAGGDLTEKIAEAESELEDIEGERNMLAENKKELEEKVFNSKVELMQLNRIIEENTKNLNNQLAAVNQTLIVNDADENSLEIAKSMTEEEIVLLKKEIEKHEQKKNSVVLKLAVSDNVLSLLPKLKAIDPSLKTKQQKRLDELTLEIKEMEEKFDYLFAVYLNSSNAKIKLAHATHELETLNRIKSVINQTQISQLVLQDKIANIVKQANVYLQNMTKGKLLVTYFNNDLIIGDDQNNLLEFSQLDNSDRLILYTSLLLAQPSTNGIKGDWLILDERIICNRGRYFKALQLIDVDLPLAN